MKHSLNAHRSQDEVMVWYYTNADLLSLMVLLIWLCKMLTLEILGEQWCQELSVLFYSSSKSKYVNFKV